MVRNKPWVNFWRWETKSYWWNCESSSVSAALSTVGEGELSHSVTSGSLRSDGLQPTRLLCGILQARTLEWVNIPFSRGSSQPRDWIWVSLIAGRFFSVWATRETQIKCINIYNKSNHIIIFLLLSLCHTSLLYESSYPGAHYVPGTE